MFFNLSVSTELNLGFPYGSAGKESACSMGDLGSIPGLGRSPEEGKGYPLWYSGLENFMDCIVHGVQRLRYDWATFTHSLNWSSGLDTTSISNNRKFHRVSQFVRTVSWTLWFNPIYECILGHDKNLSLPVGGGQREFLSAFDILLVKSQHNFNKGSEIREKTKTTASEFGSGISLGMKTCKKPGCRP